MKERIIEHSKNAYSSSPHEFSYNQIKLMIKHDCSCDNCGESIFEMWDFPVVDTDKDELLCEECYNEEYLTVCPVCEESCEKEDMTEYFFITKDTSKTVRKPVGLYKILRYPFYYGDCVFGFDNFFDNAIEKVSDLNIKEAYSIRNHDNKKYILLDCICPDCADKYTRTDFFIKAEPRYGVLIKSERHGFFADYSDEKIHRIRQEIVHRRITFRGMLQEYNSQLKLSL